MPEETEDWSKWQKLVLSELKRLNDVQEEFRAEAKSFYQEFMEFRASVIKERAERDGRTAVIQWVVNFIVGVSGIILGSFLQKK